MAEKVKKSKNSRRNFIKSNLLGSFFLATGFSLPACREVNETNNTLPIVKSDNAVNWAKVQRQFDINEDKCYLNNAGLGPTSTYVLEKVISSLKSNNNRITTGHGEISAVREKVSSFLNISPSEIAITRNSTEGMNIIANSIPLEKGDEVLISSDEHIGGSAPWLAMHKESAVRITILPLDRRIDRLDQIKKAISSKTKVVSVSHVLCTTGEILPVKEIADYCKQNGIIFCIDGAQSFGMIPIDLSDIDPDFYTTCGHKWLYGPLGTGVLFINKRMLPSCKTQYVGAYSDSKFDLSTKTLEYKNSADRLEYGTRDSSNIVGLGAAVDFINNIGIKEIQKRGKELSLYFLNRIDQTPHIKVITPIEEGKYNSIISIKIEGIDNLNIARELRLNPTLYIRGVYENNLNIP